MSVLEISELSCHLATSHGFVIMKVAGVEVNKIPFDHISAVVTKAHGITYTQNVLVKLAQHNIPVIISDKAFMPVAIITPITTHHRQARVVINQAKATQSFKNKLWQKIIIAKVKNQSKALKHINQDFHKLDELIPFIYSGDTKNIEAQAAKIYWRILLGNNFTRQRFGATPNELLNYGYMILRSSVVRSVCASGLIPALGIKHHNQYNAFCLADDIIEPFRPIVDLAVYNILKTHEHELSNEVKAILVSQLQQLLRIKTKWYTVEDSILKLCQSIAKSYSNNKNLLVLPKDNFSKLIYEG